MQSPEATKSRLGRNSRRPPTEFHEARPLRSMIIEPGGLAPPPGSFERGA
jgi:hypothetical protein